MKKYVFQMMITATVSAAVMQVSAQQNRLDKLGLSATDKLVVAYSLRQLSSSFTKAIEVRRSSDNTVQDIGFDAGGNLDTVALKTFTGTGHGFVSKWYDQSGRGINAVQTDNSIQPKIVTDGKVLRENKLPVIHTSATDYLTYSGLTQFDGISTASRFSVCKSRNETGSLIIDGLEDFKLDIIIFPNKIELQTDNQSRGIFNVEMGGTLNMMAVGSIRESEKSFLYANGDLMGKNMAALDNFGASITGYIGRRGDGTGGPGSYAEHVLFKNVLMEVDIIAIGNNQIDYYNITRTANTLSKYNYLTNLPVAAYSLRKVSNAYKGAAIQVRRSSDNKTEDIGFDANGNLKIKQLKEFTGTGDGYVSIWYDQSGTNRHKTQTIASAQPKIVSEGSVFMKNDKPVIFFSAQSKSGLAGPSKEYLTSGDITIFFNAWSNSNSAVPRRAIQGSGGRDWLVGPYKNGNGYFAGDWNLQDSSKPWSQTGELFTISQPASGPNIVYRNGAEIMKYQNVAKGYPGSIAISAAGFADEPFDGYMSELLEFNVKFSTQDIVTVQKSISGYCGLSSPNNNIGALVTTDKHLFSVLSLRLVNTEYDGPLVRLAIGASFYDVYPDDKSGISPDSPISAAITDYNAAISGNSDKPLSTVLTSSINASVAVWYDQSGEAGHFKQSEESYRPWLVKRGEIVKQAESNKPALEFSSQAKTHLAGSEDCLNGYEDGYINIVYTPTSTAETPNGEFLVSKPQSWHLVTSISTHNGGGYFNTYPEGALNEKQRVIPFFNPTIEKNSHANILSVSFNKESVVVYGNQVDVGRSSVALPPLYGNTNKLQIGGTGLAANNKNSFGGLVQELIITKELNQVERNTLELLQSAYYKTNACNTWTGVGENWNDDCNWSWARVPNSTDKAHIPRGSSQWPKISESVPMPALIVVEPAAAVKLEGSFSGGHPKVGLLADEDSTGVVINRAGAQLGEVGIQKWFTAQKGFRIVGNPFKTTQSLSENATKSGFTIVAKTEDLSAEKSAAPTALSPVVSDAQYFTNNYWKNLISGTTQAAIPYAIHYEGLSPEALLEKDYGPSPFPYYSKGEMYSGTDVSVNAANSTSQFTVAGNPFTAPVKTNALTKGVPYYTFDVTVGARSAMRCVESGMWIPRFPSENSITPVLGVVAFKQTEASPSISVPTSAIVTDSPGQEAEAKDYLRLDLEKDEEYRDRLFVKLSNTFSSSAGDNMDLEKLLNAEVNLYTTTPEKTKLSIDCRQKPVTPIPVYFSFTKGGFYNFRVRHNELADASEIHLRDRRTGRVTKLDQGAKYTFFVSDNEDQAENRFEIFAMGITTGIDEVAEKDKGIAVYPIPAKEEIVVYSNKEMEAITIYDLNGRPVLNREASGKEVKVLVNNLPRGLYIISVQNKEEAQRLKFVKE